jgi:hypothetical protein
LVKAFFYVAEGSDEPLGQSEYWLVAIPRHGETVTVTYFDRDQPHVKRHLTGQVAAVQWSIEPNDGDNTAPDWCTADIWLRPVKSQE